MTPETPHQNETWRPSLKSMKWLWAVAFFITAVSVGIAPWEAINSLLQERGVGQEGTRLLAFVAGYTLPLTSGTLIATLLGLRGAFKREDPRTTFIYVAIILALAGVVAEELGLGLLPSYDRGPPSGPPWVSIPLWIFGGYVNTYGWSLALCATTLGCVAALHVDAWLREKAAPS